MKTIYISLFLGIGIVLLVKDYPGYVLINYPPWAMETALPVFIILLVLVYFAVNYLVRLVSVFLFVRQKWGSWRKRRLGLRAQAALAHGLMQIWAGQWAAAEKILTRSANNSAYPALHLLAAAQCAQNLQNHHKRDRYLDIAKNYVSEKDAQAVALTQAEFKLQSGELEHALSILLNLQAQAPRNVRAAHVLVQCYYALRDWERLAQLIGQLHNRKMLKNAQFADYEVEAYYQLLAQDLAQGEHKTLAKNWARLPNRLREHSRLLPVYIQSLNLQGEGDKAEQLLLRAIKHAWCDTFVELYGLTRAKKVNKQLQNVEQWLQVRSQNPLLLHTAARLCMANRLWGKARSYLEASIGMSPTLERYKELGDLLEVMGEVQTSVLCYRKGLALAVRESITLDDESITPVVERDVQAVSAPDDNVQEPSKPLPKPQAGHLLVRAAED